jgi:ABC-2 type transport system permease protein
VDLCLAHQRFELDPRVSRPPWIKPAALERDPAGWMMGTMLARREVWPKVGPFDSSYIYCGDLDWLLRAKDAGVRIEVLPFYNPERRTPVFIVPGLVGVILTMTMMLMTALALVRERERGTFEFLIATPVRRSELMVGKILPYLVVGHVQVALVLALGWLLFDVPLHGSALDLGIGALPFLAAMLAMGLAISSAARTQFQATQMAFFFFLPSMLLSGFMFPFEAMPAPAQWIGAVLPLTHFLRIVRGILLKGAPIAELRGEVLAILAFLAAALVLAIATFRKRLA